MKKIILLAALFLSSSVFAANVSITKSKCSMFGNIRIKVNGLENRGTIGKGYLSANIPMNESCNDALVDFNESMGRGIQAVDVAETSRRFERRSGGGRDGDATCSIIERKTLRVTFANYDELLFKRVQQRTISQRSCY
jgi:hypothetical protein